MKSELALITFTAALALVIGICWLIQILWVVCEWIRFDRKSILPPPNSLTTRDHYNHWKDIE